MYSQLMYPLNVYAFILEQQEGSADYLHFGLYEPNGVSTQQAQQQSTELLLSLLPPPPASILEVGTGLGTLFGRLNGMGYEITGINPDANQVAIARQRLGADIGIQVCKLEEFESTKTYDLMLLQEVSQYIPVHDIFSQATRLLGSGGQVLLMDEMKATPEVESHLHAASEYLSAATRHGFTLDLEKDLTDQAKPTVDYLLDSIAELQVPIVKQLNVSEEQLTELTSALLDYRTKYADGRYLYKLYRFNRI